MNTLVSVKLALVAFWGLWYLIAFSTNLCEGLRALRILPQTWPFASGNLGGITQAMKTYSASLSLSVLLFCGVLCWQLLCVILFGWAIVSSLSAESLNLRAVNVAFLGGLGLWAAFMIADEILKQYEVEHSHVLFFIAQLVTFIAIYALP